MSAEGTTERESHWQDWQDWQRRQRQRQRQGKCLAGGVALKCRVQLQGRRRAGQALWLGVTGIEDVRTWERPVRAGQRSGDSAFPLLATSSTCWCC